MAQVASIRLDLTPWERAIDSLGRRGFSAAARALNRTTSSASVHLARGAAKDLGIGVTGVKKQFSHSRATFRDLQATVYANPRPLSLGDMGGRWPGTPDKPLPSRGHKGYRVTAMRFGKRQRYDGAFAAKVHGPLPSGVISPGHVGVFKRLRPSTHKSKGARSKNLPISELRGPSVWLVGRKLAHGVTDQFHDVLAKNLEHELAFALGR